MGSRGRGNPQTYHSPRGALSNKNRRQKRQAKQMGYDPGPNFFVPSFRVRRPVIVTDELRDFLADVRKILPRNYRVVEPENLAMTILEKRILIDRFRAINYQPEAGEIASVAEAVRESLGKNLSQRGISRRLPFQLGRVSDFGSYDSPNKLGIEPRGWKGFKAHYSEFGPDQDRGTVHEHPLMPIIIDEANLCAGAIVNNFTSYAEEYAKFSSVNPFNRTPHITIAKRKRGFISQSELSGIAGSLQELISSTGTLELFDPIVSYKSETGSTPELFTVRSPRRENVALVPALRQH